MTDQAQVAYEDVFSDPFVDARPRWGVEEMAALDRAITAIGKVGPSFLSDAGSVLALGRAISRLQALQAQALDTLAAGAEWAASGAKTPAAWLARASRLPLSDAQATVRLGRGMRRLYRAQDAFRAGEINARHMAALSALRRDSTAEALARDEEMLVGLARDLSYPRFCRALAYWEQRNDPDGADRGDEAKASRRGVWLSESFQGMFLGKMTLDPIRGSILSRELSRLEEEEFSRDWAQARDRLGTEPTVADLARSPAQRRADAIARMAVRSSCLGEGARAPAPLISILVGYETLRGRICELANGTVVSPSSVLGLLTTADFERIVFSPAGRVEVSERSRFFTGATRRAIEVRDRGCAHPYCEADLDACQVDHVIPYAAGGPTTQANGRLLCAFHNRLRHKRPQAGRGEGGRAGGEDEADPDSA